MLFKFFVEGVVLKVILIVGKFIFDIVVDKDYLFLLVIMFKFDKNVELGMLIGGVVI